MASRAAMVGSAPTATLGPKTGGNYYNEYVMMVCSFRDCGLVAACSSARQG